MNPLVKNNIRLSKEVNELKKELSELRNTRFTIVRNSIAACTLIYLSISEDEARDKGKEVLIAWNLGKLSAATGVNVETLKEIQNEIHQ